MAILTNIKRTIQNIFRPTEEVKNVVNYPIYMGTNSAVICKDTIGTTTYKVIIAPEHIDLDADIQIESPRFCVNKVTSKEGMVGMTFKNVLILDADSEPTEDSKALITSGTLYNIISDLQEQINELKQ